MPNDFGFTFATLVLIVASLALAYLRLRQGRPRYPRHGSARKRHILTSLVVLANLAMSIATISHDQATYPHTLLSIFGTAVRVAGLALAAAVVAWAQQTKRYYC